MASLEETLHDIDQFLGEQREIPAHLIEFRDAIAAAKEGRNNEQLELFLEKREMTDWEETAQCFFNMPYGFVLLRRAGKGGFGRVYKALNLKIQRLRAIKIIQQEIDKDGRAREAYALHGRQGLFSNDALLDLFDHPRIGRYYSQGMLADGRGYMEFEWLGDISLAKYGVCSPAEAHRFVTQICEAAQHMHERGMLHNDIKPENVMVIEQEPRGKIERNIKLIDSGIATPHENGKATKSRNIASREISAPESITSGELSVQTEGWAITVLLHKLITGSHPFPYTEKTELEGIVSDPESYSALRTRIRQDQRIPERDKPILIKGLSYLPKDRYQSLDEFLAVLNPKKSRISKWSLGVGALGTGLAALGIAGAVCAGVVSYYFPRVETIVSPPMVIEKATYSDTRKIQRDPRIPEGDSPPELCTNPQKYGFSATRYTDPQDYQFCLEFRQGEALLDRAAFVDAAIRLEELQKQFPKSSQRLRGLMEAYYELGLLFDVQEAETALLHLYPTDNSLERLTYGQKAQREVSTYWTTLSFDDPAICIVDAVKKRHPECSALIAVNKKSDEEKEKEYERLLKEFPHSPLIAREYARFLFADSSASLEKINRALVAYQDAAISASQNAPFLWEIAEHFSARKGAAHAYVFAYQAKEAEKEKGEIMIGDTRLIERYNALHPNSRISLFDDESDSILKQEYELLFKKCSNSKDFFIVECH